MSSIALRRLFGIVLLVVGFFATLGTIVGLGNGLGAVEAVVMFAGCAALIAVGWWLRESGRMSGTSG
jgi:hypothetical protein